MRNARCWVWFAVMLLAASLLPGCGREGKEAKPLQVALGMSTADVEAKLGKPHQTVSGSDGTTVWKYHRDQRAVGIQFKDGCVTAIFQGKEAKGTRSCAGNDHCRRGGEAR